MFHWQFLISYIFSLSLKFQTCYITGQWGEFTVKIRMLLYTDIYILSWHFYLFSIIYNFIIFISFFDEVSNFRNRILTTKKLETGDKKLWVYYREWTISEKEDTGWDEVRGGEGGGYLKTWNFQGYWKNKIWRFEGPRIGIYRGDQEKIVWNFRKSWILDIDLGISKGYNPIFEKSGGEVSFFLESLG